MKPIEWIEGLERMPDIDCGDRYDSAIKGVVIHATAGGSGPLTARWLASSDLNRSVHFMICRDGTVIQQVSIDAVSWHAGRAVWLNKAPDNVNNYTVGIELANHLVVQPRATGGFEYEVGGKVFRYHRQTPVEGRLTYPNGTHVRGYWEPFPDAQLDALEALLKQLTAVGVPPRIIGHDEIASPIGRKMDPGPLFPWARFEHWRKEPRSLISRS